MTRLSPTQPNMQQRLRDAEKDVKKPACATCGRPAKIRRFGKLFCNPHCAAQYEAPETP